MSSDPTELVIISALSNQSAVLRQLIEKYPETLEEIDHDELCKEALKLGYIDVANILQIT